MLDLVAKLPAGSRVLDLGAGPGSFRTSRTDLAIVRVDIEVPGVRAPGAYTTADAARLPFACRSFDLIVSNHSLEHFPQLEQTVREIGRVLKPGGQLYIAVPDATTWSDRIYRWMGRGGGHVNPFRSPDQVIGLVERLTGLRHSSTCLLYSSLCFLNANNRTGRPQIKSALFAFGNERFLAVLMWVLRKLDQRFHTRLSHYGWSFYFGAADGPEMRTPWINVCVRCGSAHAVAYLRKTGAIPPILKPFESYRCPACGGYNLLTGDSEGASSLLIVHDTDLVQWTTVVSGLLREDRLDEADLEHLAEGIAAFGRRECWTVRLHLQWMLRDLVALRIRPESAAVWRASIRSLRADIEARLAESPSLRHDLEENLQAIYGKAARAALADAGMEEWEPEPDIPAQCPWTLSELLDGQHAPLGTEPRP